MTLHLKKKTKKKNHHNSEGVTRRSINWGLSVRCRSVRIFQDYGGWMLLSECELHTKLHCLHCLPPTKQFFSSLSARRERRTTPASLSTMVFWFHFPISSLSHFDKVTSRCHLQYQTPFTQALWNAISNMKYCPCRLRLFLRGKHQCLPFRNQALVHVPAAIHLLRGGQNLPQRDF